MIFVGKTTKKGSVNKAFTSVGVKSATHVKVKGKDEFYKIDKNLVILSVDAHGDTGEPISYLDMEPGKRYRCKVAGKTEPIEIEDGFYSQLVFMSKSQDNTGDYYRCDTGMYVKKSEVQIPAYKAVNVPISHMLTDTKRGKHYANIEYLVLADGKKVYFPNDSIKREGDKWFYEENGSKLYGEYKTEEATYDHILVDGKVVDMDKVVLRNGEYFIKGDSEDGSDDTKIGATEVTLENPFVESSTITSFKNLTISPRNQDKLKPILESDKGRLAYTFAPNYPGPDGLMRVEVNEARTFARFMYDDGHEEIYAEYSATPVIKDGVETKEYRVQKFSIQDLGDEGIRFDFFDRKQDIAQDVIVEDGKIKAYSINGDKITDIEWKDGEEYIQERISSYKINGIQVSKIEWEHGKIKSCTLTETLEDGKIKITFVDNLANDKNFKHLAINCEFTSTIKDVEWGEGGLAAFKMGNYKFTEIEWNPDRTIHKCLVKIGNGKAEEVNFDEDKRFAQLKFMIKTAMIDQNIVPLVHSKLIEQNNGKYELKADYVQTEAIKDGTATVKKVENVQDAVKEQEKFKDNQFQTWINDDNGVVHKLSDLENTYTGVGEFEYDNSQNNAIAKILEKNKIQYSKGDLKIKASDNETATINTCSTLGYMFCSNPFTFVIGLPLLMVAATTSIVGPMSRQWKKNTLKQQTLEEVTEDIQEDVKKKCKENIDEIVSAYMYGVNKLKKRYSGAELAAKMDEMDAEFKVKYYKEVASLQMLDRGNLECEFDLSQKCKITKENYLAYLACMEKRDELQYGKHDHPDLNKILLEIERNSDLTRSEQVCQQIEKMRELGGRTSQYRAYDMQKQYAKLIVDELNKGKADDEKITVDQYLKDAKDEFMAGMAEWGSIDDKLELYKTTDEYYTAKPAQKRKLLKEKREELEGQLKKVKVDRVEFDRRYAANGESLADECMKDAMAHFEHVKVVAHTETSHAKVPKFEYGVRAKMSKEEQEKYAPSNDINETVSKKIDDNTIETLHHNAQRAEKSMGTVRAETDTIVDTLKRRNERVKRANSAKDFESAFANSAVIKSSKGRFNEQCQAVEDAVPRVRNTELQDAEGKQVLVDISKAKITYATQEKMCERTMDETRAEYQKQAKAQAVSEYTSHHTREYARFKEETIARRTENNQKELNEEQMQNLFVHRKGQARTMRGFAMKYQEEYQAFATQKVQERRAAGGTPYTSDEMEKAFYNAKATQNGLSSEPIPDYPVEFKILTIQHNIEERTMAEVYCREHPEEFTRYTEKLQADIQSKQAKAQKGKNTDFTLTSEDAICAFYAEVKDKNPEQIEEMKQEEDFEQSFADTAKDVVADRKNHTKEQQEILEEDLQEDFEDDNKKKKDNKNTKSSSTTSTVTAEADDDYEEEVGLAV